MPGGVATKRRFQLILIKPSHYDDDGYVIQWLRSVMPSNSLAALYGLAVDAGERQVLGPDVAIDVTPIDETNTRIKPNKIIARLRRAGGFGLVGLVGVQSNQYPRALDIPRPLRAAGLPVVIGGFHVSGCLAMLGGVTPDLQRALDLGVSLLAGEAEKRLDGMLRDAAAGALQPIYNFLSDLPAIEGAPVPFLLRKHVRRTAGHYSTFDAGRGCPYQCSFCTIINVQGRKSRCRSADDVERIIRQNWAQGIRHVFITDDNLARNKNWEVILDRIIKLRSEEGIAVSLMIQVDTLCHRIPSFVDKCAQAGVHYVFIGLENINPANLLGAKKPQNKITEYRKLLLAWKARGVLTYAGYIIGFPHDTPDSVAHDIAIIQRELPIDIMEFFCLTPLPGSEDHQKLWRKGVAMDSDLNRYDTEHVVTVHPRMGRDELQAVYRNVWKLLLHAGAHGAHPAAGGRDRHEPELGCGQAAAVLAGDGARGRAPVAERDRSPEIPARPPLRAADRTGMALLSKLHRELSAQPDDCCQDGPLAAAHDGAHQGRSRALRVCGRRHPAGLGRRFRFTRIVQPDRRGAPRRGACAQAARAY